MSDDRPLDDTALADRTFASETWPRAVVIFGAIACSYFLASHLALLLLSEANGVAVFWPASGLAAGAMATLDRRFRVPVALGVAVATLAANLEARPSMALIFVFAACNALECLLFAAVWTVLDRSRSRLETIGSVIAFLLSASIAAGIAALPAAMAIVWLGDTPVPWSDVWLTWFKSDGLGIVLLAPAFITWPAYARTKASWTAVAESSFVVLLTSAISIYVFSRMFAGALPVPTPAMLLFPTFVWLAARAPPFFSALALVFMSVVIVTMALMGKDHFGQAALPLPVRLQTAQALLLTGAGALLTLTAMFARVNNIVQALRSSDNRLRLALSAASMYAFEYDAIRGVFHRSGRLAPRLGLSELGPSDDFMTAVHPEDREGVMRAFARVAPDKPILQRLIRAHDINGKVLSIEYRCEGEFAADGRMLKLRGICVDVTEREAVREQIAQQTEQLSGALKAGRVFSVEYDAGTGRVSTSDNAAEILGVPHDRVRTSSNILLELAHPQDRHALVSYGSNRTRSEGYRRQTYRFIRPDGGLAWLELTSTAGFDKDGKLQSIHGLARDVTEQTRWEQRQSMLIRELDHRVKNALARMAVVVDVSRAQHLTVDDYVKVLEGRIASMARTQERLSRSRWTGVGIETLVADELAAYRTPANTTIDGPDQLLGPEAAQGLAFTLHELATNAAKYGALSRPSGKVEVRWRVDTREGGARFLSLTWREIVEGGIRPPERESYGLGVIRNLLRHEQDATVTVDFALTGLVCSIGMPLPPAVVGAEPDAGKLNRGAAEPAH